LPRPIAAAPGLENDLDVEDEADTLRIRLLRYRVFRDAARILGDRLKQPLWYREPPTRQLLGPKATPVERVVPTKSDPKRLLRAMIRIALRRKPLAALSSAPVGMKVSINDRLGAIREAVRRSGVVGIDLETLLADRQDRSFVAVTFLALLELAKRREVEVRQDALWGPITILQGVSE
jgi:segregation and condensation protein A